MQFLKTTSLFLIVNLAIMATIGFIIKALHLEPLLSGYGVNYFFLLGFCLFWGMGGAFISLLLSKTMAKWTMGLHVIDPNTASYEERQLLNTVYALCHKAGLREMPEVGYYESNELNAFATGPSKNNALIGVSSGLLNRMNQKEVEGVLGHEIAHITNGDMVTMTLIQGVVNAFAMFLARVVARLLTATGRDEDNRSNNTILEFFIRMILEIIFNILGSIVVCWFSRYREYRADEGGARYAGKQSMINALQALKNQHAFIEEGENASSDGLNTLKISNNRGGFLSLFTTHPPLDDRIERLKANRNLM